MLVFLINMGLLKKLEIVDGRARAVIYEQNGSEHRAQAAEIVGRMKPPGGIAVRDHRRWDMFQIALPRRNLRRFPIIDIKAQNLQPVLDNRQRQRQPHIAQTNDTNAGGLVGDLCDQAFDIVKRVMLFEQH